MMDFIDWVYTNIDHNVVLKQTEAETLLRELLTCFYITSFNKTDEKMHLVVSF